MQWVLRSQVVTGLFQPFHLPTYSSIRCYGTMAIFLKLDFDFHQIIFPDGSPSAVLYAQYSGHASIWR